MKAAKNVQGMVLAGLLAVAAPAMADYSNSPYALIAGMSQAEREQLRQNWRDLPPEEREALRRQMRNEAGDDERQVRQRDEERNGFGRGYEHRRHEGNGGRGGRR